MGALLLTLLAAVQAAPIAERVELPPGPAREALANAELPAWRPLPRPDPGCWIGRLPPPCYDVDYADDGWQLAETWCAWASRLAERPSDEPQARADLARLALLQSRWDDAWAHLAAAPEPELVLLTLLPGVPPGEADERKDALPDGVVLTPAPPPPSPDARPGFWDVREAWVRGLRVGEAVLDVRVAIEPEGVQVDLEHVSGGAARLAVKLPEPEGFEIRVEYVDWLRQDALGLPLEVVVKPGDEPHSLYGRVLPRRPAWPTAAPEHVPAAIEEGGLALLVDDADDPERERLDAVARALGHGCRLVSERPDAGVTIHLPPPGPERDRKLAWLASCVESALLAD